MSNYHREATHHARPVLVDSRAGEGLFCDLPMSVYDRLSSNTIYIDFAQDSYFSGANFADVPVAAFGGASNARWTATESGATATITAVHDAGTYGPYLRLFTTATADAINAVLNYPTGNFSVVAGPATSQPALDYESPIMNLWCFQMDSPATGLFLGMTNGTSSSATEPISAAGAILTTTDKVGWFQTEGGAAYTLTGTVVDSGGTARSMTEVGTFDIKDSLGDTLTTGVHPWVGHKIIDREKIEFFAGLSPYHMYKVGYVDLSAFGTTISTARQHPAIGMSGGSAADEIVALQKMVAHQPNVHNY